jgi:hypothetical protein
MVREELYTLEFGEERRLIIVTFEFPELCGTTEVVPSRNWWF